MRVQEVAARLVEKSFRDLVAAIEATPPDRYEWRASQDARTARELVADVAAAHWLWRQVFAAREWAWADGSILGQELRSREGALDGMTVALAALAAETDALAQVMRSLPDTALEVGIQPPDRPELAKPIAECLFHPYWNAVYHEGQIAFIQTLYGVLDEHGDPGPFGA